jgi:hypothetical protein
MAGITKAREKNNNPTTNSSLNVEDSGSFLPLFKLRELVQHWPRFPTKEFALKKLNRPLVGTEQDKLL